VGSCVLSSSGRMTNPQNSFIQRLAWFRNRSGFDTRVMQMFLYGTSRANRQTRLNNCRSDLVLIAHDLRKNISSPSRRSTAMTGPSTVSTVPTVSTEPASTILLCPMLRHNKPAHASSCAGRAELRIHCGPSISVQYIGGGIRIMGKQLDCK
jgi:hypothetical protein